MVSGPPDRVASLAEVLSRTEALSLNTNVRPTAEGLGTYQASFSSFGHYSILAYAGIVPWCSES